MSDYIITSNGLHNTDELMHYGVLGMKWGVRRGMVTATTRNQFGDYYTPKQKQKMTKTARKVLSSEYKTASRMGKLYGNSTKKDCIKIGKSHIKQAKMLQKKLEDIDSGKLKAGKDFVTNTTYSTNLLLDAVGLINVGRSQDVKFRDKR
jgi:hypothetical protein